MLVFVPPEKACPVVQAFSLSVGRCPTPCHGRVFEKTPLGTLKNFFRFVKAKPDGLWVFRERTLSCLKRRTPLGSLALLLWDAVPLPAKERF